MIPLEKLFPGRNDILVYRHPTFSLADQSGLHSLPQRRPGPNNPQWKIPPSEWPTVLRRVEGHVRQSSPMKQLLQRAEQPPQMHELVVQRILHASQQMHMGDFAGCIHTCAQHAAQAFRDAS